MMAEKVGWLIGKPVQKQQHNCEWCQRAQEKCDQKAAQNRMLVPAPFDARIPIQETHFHLLRAASC